MRRLLPLLLVLALGCDPVVVDPFNPRVTPTPTPVPTPGDDDDAATDDDDAADDDDAVGDVPPVLIVTTPDPIDPLAGPVALAITLTDPDSTAVTVEGTWRRDDAGGPLSLGGPEPGAVAFELGAPPHDAVEQALTWASDADLPGDAVVQLELCPRDDDGLLGDCVLWPSAPHLVANGSAINPGALCVPGDREPIAWSAGESLVHLSDGQCLNLQASSPPAPDDFQARFLLLLANPEPTDVPFRITRVEPQAANGPTPPGPPPTEPPPQTAFPQSPPPAQPRECTAADPVVHVDSRTVLLRDSLATDERSVHGAVLRALGDSVAVYVDSQTPLDVDYECDGVVDLPSPNGPAGGFDNCALQQFVDVFDLNISPTVAGAFGPPSDVDGDCRVTVLISHRVNGLAEPGAPPVRSFAEPAADLWQLDLTANPYSNEEEILYAYAPDPLGIWSDAPVPLAGYLDYELAGRLAVALEQLSAYARRLGVTDALLDPTDAADLALGPPLDPWLDDGFGLLAADLAGFGATAWIDAWNYLDAPHLASLQQGGTLGSFGDRGGPYLFARYLVDRFGTAVLGDLLDEPSEAEAAVLAATGQGLEALVADWAEALAVSGVTLDDGSELVDPADLPQFLGSATVVVADPESPQPGELFGANGYQQGFELNGLNRAFAGGADAAGPVEDEDARVLARNLDPLVFHPQFDFFGSVAGGWGVAAVLIDGLQAPVNDLLVETATGADLVGRLIRLPDAAPSDPTLTVEGISGTLLTTPWPVSTAAGGVDGQAVLGRIEAPDTLVTVAPDGTQTTVPVPDVDVFRVDLPALGTWALSVSRRFDDLQGQPGLGDVFLAVARAGDLPDVFDAPAWVDAACSSPAYNPPTLVPEWVFDQAVLRPDPRAALGWTEPAPGAGLACSEDLDLDGVRDVDEIRPGTLTDQVRLQQARVLAADPAAYDDLLLVPGFEDLDGTPWFGPAMFDLDSFELPDDAVAASVPAAAAGGRSMASGEDAVWVGTLGAGAWDLVVGAADGSEGTYVLEVVPVLPTP